MIGPATAKTAEEHGLRVDVLAAEPDVEALVDALADFGAGLAALAPPRRASRSSGRASARPSTAQTAGAK